MSPFLLVSAAMARPGSQDPRAADTRRRSVLLALGELLRTEVELDVLLRRVIDLLTQAMDADRATLFVIEQHSGELVSRAAHLPELPEIRLSPGQGIAGYVAKNRVPVNIPHADAHPSWDAEVDRRTGYRTVTILSVPVLGQPDTPAKPVDRPLLGVLQVLNKKTGIFDDEDQALLLALADEVATALTETTLPERVTGRVQERYNRIVGDSTPMQRVYDVIGRAASTTATVLLYGESGTGKELAARAIHVNSSRARGPFVKLDCTSIPEGLMETELFGHEKGAFTGADQRVPGKAELAHNGTLFLDEIGDLKGPLQGKLLRLLQDREFERVGGRKTLSVDLRIVAATHRDLLHMLREGSFRSDLYYRLKVVELHLPPLRERGPEDIERLTHHFIDTYARRYRKPVRGLTREAMVRLCAAPWPGNIRELEHCIESAVVLCRGTLLEADELPLAMPLSLPQATGLSPRPAPVPAAQKGQAGAPPGPSPHLAGKMGTGIYLPDGLPLEEVEQRYLGRALLLFGGNRFEAARSLGIGRNTLFRKLRGPQKP